MLDQVFVDVVRGLHLLFLALGMGSAFYLEFRTLTGLNRVLQDHDIGEMVRIHRIVAFAFGGLWITGLYLVWIRTGFDPSRFSPKLWCKLAVVSAMTLNAMVIRYSVLPAMAAQVGQRVIDLRARASMPLAVVASFSMFCWMSALALGSSKILKTAPWDVLIMGLSGLYTVVIFGGVVVFFGLRTILLWLDPRPDPHDMFHGLAQRH